MVRKYHIMQQPYLYNKMSWAYTTESKAQQGSPQAHNPRKSFSNTI